MRLSQEARRVLQKEDKEHILCFNSRLKDRRCIHLVRSVLKMGSNVIWGEEEEVGYNSLIEFCIYQKAQMPKDNKHEEYSVLVLGQTEYVLKEIYSGFIQKQSSNIQQCTQYIFASKKCTYHSGNDLICIY